MPAGTYTLLFTDLVRSTEALDQLGDVGHEPLRRTHARLMRSQIEAHRGRLVKDTGDGVMASFPSASDGVNCAIAVQQAVDLHNRTSGLRPLEVRVGLHLGEVEEDEGDLFGTAVVVTDRLCKLAGGGQILVSDLMRAVVASRGEFKFELLGERSLKGFADPVVVSSVIWEPLAQSEVAAETDPFVGREVELRALTSAWEEASRGSRKFVLISGEPGIGKSRLALRLAESAASQDAVVLIGRCDEQTPVPYLPFSEALAPHVESDLTAIAAPVAVPVPGGEDADRYRFYAAVTNALQQLAATSPVLLILDDLHWADEGTLLLLRHLLRRVGDVPLLVVGTYRDTDLGRTHPLARTLGEFAREGAQRVDLRGLGVDDVSALLGSDVSDATAQSVHAETEGNPFFVQEVARHLAEGGDSSAGSIPQGVRDVIGRRVSRLREDSVALLQVASVVGRDFDVSVITLVANTTDDQTVDALEEATRARLVEEVPGILDRYRFSHALVRDALREEVGTSRRVRLHDRIVSAIEQLHAGDLALHSMALAHHSMEAAAAGNTVRAAEYALFASQYAIGRFGVEEAVSLCTQGLQVLDMGDDDARLRCELLLARGDALAWHDADRSIQDALAAQSIARSLGDAVLLARGAVASFAMEVGVYAVETVARLQEALGALPEAETDLRAALLGMLSAATLFKPDLRQAAELSRQAIELAATAVDERLTAAALYWGTLAAAPSERLELGSRIITLSDRRGEAHLAFLGRAARCRAMFNQGDVNAARLELEALRQLTSTTGIGMARYYVSALDSTFASIEGRFADARQHARDAAARAREAFGAQFGPVAETSQAILALPRLREQGRSEILVPTTEAAAVLQPNAGWDAAYAALLADVDRLDDARAALERMCADGFKAFHSMLGIVDKYSAALAIETAARVGAKSILGRLYDLLVPEADRGVELVYLGSVLQWLGSVQLYLGIAAKALGRIDPAEDHLRRALDVHDRVGARPLAAWTRHHLAITLDARDGGREESAVLRKEVDAVASELGLVRLQRAVAQSSSE